MGAETKVFPYPKPKVGVGVAINAKRVRVLEDFFIAIRRWVEEREDVVFANHLVTQLKIFGCGAPEVDDRRCPTHDFFNRIRQQTRVVLQASQFVLVLDEGQHAASCRVAGGFVARDHDDETPSKNIHLGQLFAIDFELGEQAHEIVARVLTLFVNELAEVHEELSHCCLRGFGRSFAFDGEVGIACADNAIGPVEEQVPIFAG